MWAIEVRYTVPVTDLMRTYVAMEYGIGTRPCARDTTTQYLGF